MQFIKYERLISVFFCFGEIFLLCEFLLVGKLNASKYVLCRCWQVIRSSPSELSEGMLHCTVLQWPCNAILYAGPSGQLLYTISLYVVLKGPAQHFLSRPVVRNMGTEWWWLCLYCWRSPAHTSVPCTALSLTSWPDRATSSPNFMNHALWTHSTAHILPCCWLALLQQTRAVGSE